MATAKMYLEWTDALQGWLRTGSWVDTGGSPAGLFSAMQTASNAQLDFATVSPPFISVVGAVDATYPSVQDVAVFNFATIPGAGLQLVVPAPLAALLAPGGLSVDPAAPLSAAVIAAAIGTLSDASGNLATSFTSGVKTSRRRDQQ